MILVDRYENGLHDVGTEIQGDAAHGCETVVGDVTDDVRMSAVFSSYRPEIVLHAAAHKHVPLMESSPGEAVKNNVRGTRIVAELADRHGSERFVLISTDKAVNPTSVMGASKRVAELVVRGLATPQARRSRAFGSAMCLAATGASCRCSCGRSHRVDR